MSACSASSLDRFSAPASLSVGEKATFSANLSGDPDASPLVSFLVEGDVWVAGGKPMIISLRPGPGGYSAADARTYEIVDGNKVLNDYVRQHPDKASKLQGALTRPIVFRMYGTGGAGDRNISVRWIYVPEK
jgi:hypothetical protein